jgi:GNAT superfamily N-acetyltransferase
VGVRVRTLGQRDASACDEIVLDLPYHFGSGAGRAACATAVRTQPGFVAVDDGQVVGFATFEHRFDAATEITWMAVRASRRREGIGGKLLDGVARAATEAGRSLLLVLTVSPTDGPDEVADGYQATRAFYEASGFSPVRDFPGHWDADTPVLMVRVLG